MTRGKKVAVALTVVAGLFAIGGGFIMVDKAQREAEIGAWYASLPAGEDYEVPEFDCGNDSWEAGAVTEAQHACIREVIEDVEARKGNDYLRRCHMVLLELGLELGYEPFYPNLRAAVMCASMGRGDLWPAIGVVLAQRGGELSDVELGELQVLTNTLEPTGIWSQALVNSTACPHTITRQECMDVVYQVAQNTPAPTYSLLTEWVYSVNEVSAWHAFFAQGWALYEDPVPHLRQLHTNLESMRQNIVRRAHPEHETVE